MQWNEVDLLVSPVATDLVALLVYECGSNGSVIDDEQPDRGGPRSHYSVFSADTRRLGGNDSRKNECP